MIVLLAIGYLGMVACVAQNREQTKPLEGQAVLHFSSGVTEEALNTGGITILDPSPDSGAQWMRNNLAFEIFQGVRTGFPKAKVYSRRDSNALLVQAGLHQEVEAFFRDYPRRGLIDWELLSRVGATGKTRYLFFSKIIEVDKMTEVQVLDQGEKMIGGKVRVFSSGPNMLPVSVSKAVRLHGEVWDLSCRTVVWAGEGEATMSEPAGSERYRVEALFISAARLLVGSLQQSVQGAAEKESFC